MKPEVRNFIESLKPEFPYINIGNDGQVMLPYLGLVKIDDSMTNFGIIQMIAQSVEKQGITIGKQELANDLKKLLQIPNDYD